MAVGPSRKNCSGSIMRLAEGGLAAGDQIKAEALLQGLDEMPVESGLGEKWAGPGRDSGIPILRRPRRCVHQGRARKPPTLAATRQPRQRGVQRRAGTQHAVTVMIEVAIEGRQEHSLVDVLECSVQAESLRPRADHRIGGSHREAIKGSEIYEAAGWRLWQSARIGVFRIDGPAVEAEGQDHAGTEHPQRRSGIEGLPGSPPACAEP